MGPRHDADAPAASCAPGRFDLTGRIALVTGASRGIGRAIAVGLAEAGADVVVHYASAAEAAADCARAIESLGRRAWTAAAEFSRPGSGAALAREVLGSVAQLDILVLNAGGGRRQAFVDVTAEGFLAQAHANFLAGFELLQACLPPMAARGWGRVVTIGSVQQVRPNPALAVYAAMKSAQLNLVVNLAKQYARHGVTINNLAPGMIATDSTAPQLAQDATVAALLEEIPARSIGQPADCVGPVLMLCSEAGRYVTGVDLFVDGGMHLPGRAAFIGADGRVAPS
jgi:NAD(P)-dependent dehydrogenase (short-subunit alcohol dehydrogenase family)